ncbi:cellulase family glycosylhydrolase [Williamsia maris]|uniref:Cellulase (Glycosyl hydrolase family 5) n=1 Tax=Williamsia maris TaxID=72806 RepID=A0ABT1HE27_9NOCA|nr:cellulase family glycosylhydrolase [Williamsia maris]MCP2176511.1 Cellulase (glycosyl hydrolase family 5) [Williamsia maris]
MVVIVAMVVGMGMIAATPGVSQAAQCQVAIGVSPGSAVFDYSDAQLTQSFSETRTLGASWVRIDIPWSLVEATRGTLAWSRVDRLVNAARARGLNVLGLITYTPKWARVASSVDSDKLVPANANDFGVFAGQVARHYQGSVAAYEIWNEPNLQQFFLPQVNPTKYVSLLKAASTAIRQVSPQTYVLSGGVTGASNTNGNMHPTDFVRAMYAAGAAGSMNAVAMHPYTYPLDPADTRPNQYNYFNEVPVVHDVMSSNGDGGKPIWITEYGAPTGQSQGSLSPAAQSTNITNGIRRALQLGYVGNFFVYSMRDTGTNIYDREQNFGMRYNNDTPKPAYTDLARLLNGC